MKINFSLLLTFLALLAAGCSTTPSRTSASFLGTAIRYPSRHQGELVASFGSVVSVRESGGATVFRVTTPNYAYVFDLSYPGEVPHLDKDRDVSFLGTITGVIDSDNVYSGKVLTVDAIVVQPFGKKAVYREDQEDLAQSWLHRRLNVEEGGGALAPRRQATAEPAPIPAAPVTAPAPQVAAGGDATALRALLKQWNGSSGEVKAKLRDLLERWNSLSDGERALFLEWNGLSDEDKTLFHQLVTDHAGR